MEANAVLRIEKIKQSQNDQKGEFVVIIGK